MKSNIYPIERVIERLNIFYNKKQNDSDIKQVVKVLEGVYGELKIRNDIFTLQKDIKFMQIDGLIKFKGIYFSLEIKHQEMFTKGSNINFDGHGLPEHQVKARLELFNDKGIVPLLIILDMESKEVYYNRLDVLDSGKKAITGKVRRIIYPIENFHILKQDFLEDL